MPVDPIYIPQISINSNKTLTAALVWCKSCGICMRICPEGVLDEQKVTGTVIITAPDKCTGCGLCELYCPDYVFSIQEDN